MSTPDIRNQPRVKHNDYSTLSVPKIGEWEPRLSVSVVIPAYGAQEKLDLTLAALAGQSYPSHLLEVVVVDDGSTPPLRLPDIVPERVRLVRTTGEKWGRAHACKTGAGLAEGEVIHWLDSDMVTFSDHVEAQMRWHHLADYLVVLGYKRFVDYGGGELSQREVFDAVVGGAAEKLFDVAQSQRHEWVENVIDKTNGLRTHGSRSFGVHVGATASVRADLLRAVGGMDDTLVLGEDTDLGFRLAQQGAVFIPDPEARSWHLGPSTVMRRREQVNRHNEAYLSDRLPTRRLFRRWPGRQWLVPYVDVVVNAAGRPYEEVRPTIAAALASIVPDVRVTVVGPWSDLKDGRRAPLDDPLLDLRLVRDWCTHETRVRLVERLPETSAPTPFRFTCPPGWMLAVDALRDMIELAHPKDLGLLLLAVPDGADVAVGRFERTAAVARALVVRDSSEKLDDVIDELFSSLWVDGTESMLVPVEDAPLAYLGQEGLKWKRQAERLEAEVARLKKKLQAPLGSKLKDAARRRVSRGRPS